MHLRNLIFCPKHGGQLSCWGNHIQLNQGLHICRSVSNRVRRLSWVDVSQCQNSTIFTSNGSRFRIVLTKYKQPNVVSQDQLQIGLSSQGLRSLQAIYKVQLETREKLNCVCIETEIIVVMIHIVHISDCHRIFCRSIDRINS